MGKKERERKKREMKEYDKGGEQRRKTDGVRERDKREKERKREREKERKREREKERREKDTINQMVNKNEKKSK